MFDAQAQVLAPGFIDLHVHVTGGGGEDGFSSRSPESRLTDFSTAGVTTLVGLLGTDGVARSLEALYAKVCALTEEGVDCRMLTGAYGYPSPTLCGSVERDLVLIDRMIGAKIALSDHRSSEITYEELLRLATAVRRGGMLGGKAGLLTLHMGDGREGLSKLFRAAKESEVPLNTFLPTHVSRNGNLLEEAVRWIKAGGQADFTAGEPAPGGTARQMVQALSEGADVCRMTLSSDAFGSQPRFDAQGNCIGLTYGTSRVLHGELVNLVPKRRRSAGNGAALYHRKPRARDASIRQKRLHCGRCGCRSRAAWAGSLHPSRVCPRQTTGSGRTGARQGPL